MPYIHLDPRPLQVSYIHRALNGSQRASTLMPHIGGHRYTLRCFPVTAVPKAPAIPRPKQASGEASQLATHAAAFHASAVHAAAMHAIAIASTAGRPPPQHASVASATAAGLPQQPPGTPAEKPAPAP